MVKAMSKKLKSEWGLFPDSKYKGKQVGRFIEEVIDEKAERINKVKVINRVELYGGTNRGAIVVLWREHTDNFTKNPKYYAQSDDGKFYGMVGNFWNFADALEKYENMNTKDDILTFIEQCYD